MEVRFYALASGSEFVADLVADQHLVFSAAVSNLSVQCQYPVPLMWLLELLAYWTQKAAKQFSGDFKL